MPEDRKNFDLGDYVEVRDRIKLFYELYGNGRLVTDWAEVWEHGEKVRVVVKASAYRTPDDPHPATGYSWMEVPGTTPYTRGSELENTETSAWGRAIAALGILVDRSIASANEVRAKQDDAPARPVTVPARKPTHEATSDGGLIGIAQVGEAPADYNLRQEPEGPALSFKLMDGRKGFRVVARDDLAEALSLVQGDVIGARITCWGRMGKAQLVKGGQTIEYNVLELDRIQSPSVTLPIELTTGNADGARAESSGEPTPEPSAPTTLAL